MLGDVMEILSSFILSIAIRVTRTYVFLMQLYRNNVLNQPITQFGLLSLQKWQGEPQQVHRIHQLISYQLLLLLAILFYELSKCIGWEIRRKMVLDGRCG